MGVHESKPPPLKTTKGGEPATELQYFIWEKWCRGGELNSLRRPFQGRALPVSYPGTGA